MRDEVKNSILNKNSFLIYGYDHGYNIDIFNELVEGLEARHNEIFYFDTVGYSQVPKFKSECHDVEQEIDLFEFFKDKVLDHNLLDRYVRDISNCINNEYFERLNDLEKQYLPILLREIYNSEYANKFSMIEFTELLRIILEGAKSKCYYELYNKLDEIEIVKAKNPENYIADLNFDKLARDARGYLEKFLAGNPKDYQYLKLILKYSKNDSATKYFKKLYERIENSDTNKFSNKPKTVIDKINLFRISEYKMKCNYLDMFLSNLVRKLKIKNSQNKPLIFIIGKQKGLFSSVNIEIRELFKYCAVCFIVNDRNELDARINDYIDVKIYSDKHKSLSLDTLGIEKRIENGYGVHYRILNE